MASNYGPSYTQTAIGRCEVCDEGMISRFYCKECKQKFCGDCKTKHLRMRVSRNHTIISVTGTNTSDDDRMCRTHPDTPIEMYCVTCDLLVCLACTTDKTHKNHEFYQHGNGSGRELHDKKTKVVDESRDRKIKMERKPKNKPISSGTSVNISTDVISRIEPGIKCFIVSAVRDKEAWCGPGLNNGTDLILVTTHGVVLIKEKLEDNLYDTTVTSSGNLLFTECGFHGNEIKKRYLSDGRVATMTDMEQYGALGLCMTAEKDILVCLCHGHQNKDRKVVRMTLSGQVIQTVQYNGQKKPLFRNPLLVAENVNGDICVVDNSDTVTVVNKDGQYRFNYPESQESNSHTVDPIGLACDKLGYLLVSDLTHNRIHLVNSDGLFVQFVVTKHHGIDSPWGLCVDNTGQLWVCNRHGKEITVYKYRS